jgi:hypothetical protein
MTSKWLYSLSFAVLVCMGISGWKWEDHKTPLNDAITAGHTIGALATVGLALTGVKRDLEERSEAGFVRSEVTLTPEKLSPTNRPYRVIIAAQVGDPSEYRSGYGLIHPGTKLAKLKDVLRTADFRTRAGLDAPQRLDGPIPPGMVAPRAGRAKREGGRLRHHRWTFPLARSSPRVRSGR